MNWKWILGGVAVYLLLKDNGTAAAPGAAPATDPSVTECRNRGGTPLSSGGCSLGGQNFSRDEWLCNLQNGIMTTDGCSVL